MIWLTIILALLFLGFYNYLLSEFVHFMNTYILVPVQRFINEVIHAINKIINITINKPIASINELKNIINKPFKGLHHLSIKASLGKVFGKNLGFEIKPFREIIPEEIIKKDIVPNKLVPNVPKLPVKCIPEPPGYEDVFGFKRPRECEKKGKKDKPKASILSDGALKYYILFLILCLLMLMVFIYNSKEDAGLTGTGVETASSETSGGLSVATGALGASSVATGALGALGAVPDALGASSVATGALGALGAVPDASSVATGASSVATGALGAVPGAPGALGANGGLPGAGAAASSASAAWL
jgi:hypothetical protein